MTKEEFLSGTLFRIIGEKYTAFRFSPNQDADCEPGHVNLLFGKDAFSPVADEYHCNVKKVTKTRFLAYHAICGRTVRVWRNLSDYEVIEKK